MTEQNHENYRDSDDEMIEIPAEDFEKLSEDANQGRELMGDDALAGMLTDLSGDNGASVKIYRTGTRGRKWEYLFSAGVDDYTMDELLDKLRDEYDGGDFRIQIRKGNKLIANRAISVAAPKKPVENSGHELRRDMEKMQSQQNDSLAQVMSAMQRSTDANMKMIMEMGQRQSDNMLQMMTALMTNKNSGDSFGVKDMIQLLPTIKELTAGNNKSKGEIDLFLKGLEFAKENTQETGMADVMMQALQGITTGVGALGQGAQLPTASPVAERAQQAAAEMQGQPGNATPPAPVSETAPPPATGEGIDPELVTFIQTYGEALRSQLVMYTQMASVNGDPEIYANVCLDAFGADFCQRFFSRDDCIDLASKMEPGVLQYREWFTEMRLSILDMVGYDESEPPAPGNVNEISNTNDNEIDGATAGPGGDTSDPELYEENGSGEQNPSGDIE